MFSLHELIKNVRWIITHDVALADIRYQVYFRIKHKNRCSSMEGGDLGQVRIPTGAVEEVFIIFTDAKVAIRKLGMPRFDIFLK
jgi:hypothetical protein